MGYGYGSEFHLLRFLGRHRKYFDKRVKEMTGARSVDWRDYRCKDKPDPPSWDSEWVGLDFLPESSEARKKWAKFWPTSGNQQNWDAVGCVFIEERWEWLMVEAKSHLGELKSNCRASENGGLPTIRKALCQTKNDLGIDERADWLKDYYQHANRIATLNFMIQNGECGRLLFVYFCGDRFPPDKKVNCPKIKEGWLEALKEQDRHLGLSKDHPLSSRVHKIFVPVTKVDSN